MLGRFDAYKAIGRWVVDVVIRPGCAEWLVGGNPNVDDQTSIEIGASRLIGTFDAVEDGQYAVDRFFPELPKFANHTVVTGRQSGVIASPEEGPA